MPRRRKHSELRVCLNNRLVGKLSKEPSGAIRFHYDTSWLEWDYALPVSLSLPLREEPIRGQPVTAVFDNLLPDSEELKRRVADRVGAAGTDSHSLLHAIGRDCVGALQFFEDGAAMDVDSTRIDGDPISGDRIARMLRNLPRAPLGLDSEDDFRISISGMQNKTALLRHNGRWLKPRGAAPTTHIFKTQIGRLSNGLDLSNSIENEFYCLQLLEAFGLPVATSQMRTFADTKALVIERFDRHLGSDGRLLRLPQEDFCQALSVPPTRKYQRDGGPGMLEILRLLGESDTPVENRKTLLKAQILFWLIGATDGHAKNFSIFLHPGGGFSLTPLYDVLTAQPGYDARQMQRKQMKLAMSIGDGNQYRMEQILGRHFIETGKKAGLPPILVRDAISDVVDCASNALQSVETRLPPSFPEVIHESVKSALKERLRSLKI